MDLAKWDRIRRDEEAPALGPVRFSHLRAYGRSPMHGHHARTKDGDATRAMERGTAVHALIFGNRPVCGYPGLQRRGKDYDAFAAEHQGHEILTMGEFEKARRMADAVKSCKLAEPYLLGTHEETLLFRWMGLDCRATPDVRGADYLTELKTSASSEPTKFLWHARRMHYHAQMRFQGYACEAKQIPVLDHWIVCVESDEPHPVTVFHVEPEALEEGEKLLMLWAERMKNSEASSAFPPYVECAVPLMWPKDDELIFGDDA
jgi:hypothetical protein